MRNSLKLVTLTAGLACLAASAHAEVSERLKQACRDEYFTYCSAYPVGSPALRKCMRASQALFSDGCLRELVAAGEASKRDVMRYRARRAQRAGAR